ncbi:hypothetical protein ACWDA7_41680, partial [Streptomyces sp. NPDC001156]
MVRVHTNILSAASGVAALFAFGTRTGQPTCSAIPSRLVDRQFVCLARELVDLYHRRWQVETTY